MKPRTPVKRISEKKRASLGNKPVYSTITAKPKKRKSWKRKPSEFKRIYGSKKRVEFVKSLPCAACGVVGYSENAHVLGNGGLSRKGDYTTIAPLCRTRPETWGNVTATLIGCHELYDRYRQKLLIRFPLFRSDNAVADCESAWLLHIGEAHQNG